MILSHGTEEYREHKKKIIKYKFFNDPYEGGKDAIFGLDIHLMKLVNVFKAASRHYGTERRVILLHGPVGSSKSTITRLLKKGLETYSKTPEGALYTFTWLKNGESKELETIFGSTDKIKCPMHEDPLHLIPKNVRDVILDEINTKLPMDQQIVIEGDLCPSCRFIYNALFENYNGDWEKVISHI
ncbi:MAG: hypothetical protein ACD_73C00631G0001, partial [uncultured bacterium]